MLSWSYIPSLVKIQWKLKELSCRQAQVGENRLSFDPRMTPRWPRTHPTLWSDLRDVELKLYTKFGQNTMKTQRVILQTSSSRQKMLRFDPWMTSRWPRTHPPLRSDLRDVELKLYSKFGQNPSKTRRVILQTRSEWRYPPKKTKKSEMYSILRTTKNNLFLFVISDA